MMPNHMQAGVYAGAPHGVSGRTAIQASAIYNCQGNQYDWHKIMPGTGQTAQQLFVRTHTFNPKQARPGSMTADKLAPPSFFYAPK
jgi:hypothetical protein